MTRSLSGRLLIVTILAVMLIEVVIFIPSVARFRQDYLQERLRLAELASLAILATPEGMLDPTLEGELLRRTGATSIVLRRDGSRALALSDPEPRPVKAIYDLRGASAFELIADALTAMWDADGGLIRVVGEPGANMDTVEITLPEAPLRRALLDYGQRILALSLIISIGSAVLIYYLARRLLLRPMKRMVANMMAFQEDPEDASRVITPESRITELAMAERALAEMQSECRDSIRQKARLAMLGEAVARIAHDLRNMLSTAQILADRLDGSRDPVVARIGPKLVGSLGRAVGLCQGTLRYGAAREADPVPRRLQLRAVVGEAAEAVFPDLDDAPASVRFENRVPEELSATADPDQLHRILVNLVRNARAAVEAAGRGGAVRVEARAANGAVEIDVSDEGPGLPQAARDNLFRPFRGGAKGGGGAGLGLAIARDLAAMQGGALELVSTGPEGATFRVVMPS